MVATVWTTAMEPLTAMISTFQPFSRFSSLLGLARIVQPVRHLSSCMKVSRNKLHSFSKISADGLVCVRWTFPFLGRLATQGHLCISHCCCHAHQLGRSDLCQSGLVLFFGVCIHECQDSFLQLSRTPISARFGHGVCASGGILFTLCIR